MAPNPHTPLPLERLLTQLKREGFHISPDVYVGIQACLESHAQDWANYDRAALRADICLLVAKSEQERKRFFECFDVLYTQLPQSLPKERVYTPSIIPSVSQEVQMPFLFGGIVLVLFLVFVGVDIHLTPQPTPILQFNVPTCNKVGNFVYFDNLSKHIPANTSYLWDFGDGTQDSIHYSSTHTYTQAGTYVVSLKMEADAYTDTIHVYSPLQAKLLTNPQDVRLNQPINFSFELIEPKKVDNLSIRWDLDALTAFTPQFSYTFREAKRYTLTLTLQRQDDCEPLTLTKVFDFRSQSVVIAEYPFLKHFPKNISSRNPWAIWLYIPIVLFIILFLSYLIGKGFDRYNAHIPSHIKQEVDEVLRDKHAPPYWQELPNRRDLLQEEELLYSMATKLRIPEDSARHEIDVFGSLDATIIGGGVPHIRLKALKKRVSYLVLIEQEEVHNQQRKLFHYWLSSLAEVAEIDLVQYFFRDDPRQLKHASTGQDAHLGDIVDLYPQHHLLFIGTGEALLTSQTEGEHTQLCLRNWVKRSFGKWKRKSLFTPKAIHTWSHKETLLQDCFDLYAMSPEGQAAFAASHPSTYSPNPVLHPPTFDWNTKEGLEAYFGSLGKPHLLKWLAATVVYPLPDLNICLITGNLLGYETTYANLYALTHIPWMQTGELSPDLRTSLLAILSPEERSTIHQVIHSLLGNLKGSLPKDSRAWLIAALQQYIIDAELGKLPKKYIQYLSNLSRLPETVSYHINQIPKRISMLLTCCILTLCSLFIWQYLPQMKPSIYPQLSSLLYTQSPPDSAVIYTNWAIDSLDTNLPLAEHYLDKALLHKPDYEPALRYKAALGDKRAELAYAQGDFSTAIEYWQGQLALQDSHHVHRLHSLGLCYFFQRELDSARFYRDRILSHNENFFSGWKYMPNLATMLITPDEIASLLQQADSLVQLGECKEALVLYDQILNLNPTHVKALLGKQRCEEEPALVLPKLEEDTSIVHVAVNLPNVKDGSMELAEPLVSSEDIPAITSNPVDDNMVLVQGGEYRMSDSYVAKLAPFWIAKTEVTFDKYDRFCEATGRDKPDDSGWGRGKRPVMNVNWYDAVEYCNWLSVEAGFDPCYAIDKNREDPNNINPSDDMKWTVRCDFNKNGYRLPTEAEWEYAATGGVESKGHIYAGTSDMDSLHLYGNYEPFSGDDKDGYKYTSPVRSYRPNELGLYDMGGNVWEWCWDWHSIFSPTEPIENPVGAKGGTYRGLRGGSWNFNAEYLEVSDRNRLYPDSRSRVSGFRLARTLP